MYISLALFSLIRIRECYVHFLRALSMNSFVAVIQFKTHECPLCQQRYSTVVMRQGFIGVGMI